MNQNSLGKKKEEKKKKKKKGRVGKLHVKYYYLQASFLKIFILTHLERHIRIQFKMGHSIRPGNPFLGVVAQTVIKYSSLCTCTRNKSEDAYRASNNVRA